jgi:hypothetical protein
MNSIRLVTPAVSALLLLSLMRTGSMSTQTPRAPYFLTAMMTIRPSPHPRS